MKIAIAGYGIEGKSSYDYWNQPGNQLTVLDETENPHAFDDLGGYDMVIRSPGIAPKKLASAKKVWSATNEFFARCAEKKVLIIGVTGTKGKGTTSSLIASILNAAGRNVHLVGNIGTPALKVLPRIQPGDIVVFELSSFQLWDIETSPHIAVVLMIEPDHLDVHDSMIDYIGAKTRIVSYQTSRDIVVFNKDNRASTAIGEVSKAKKVLYPFPITEFKDSLKIPGQHNQENASAAIAAVGEYVTEPEVIKTGLAAFEGLPHRLKFVAEKNGVKYYDDSIATTPGSAIAAINSFTQPKVLILGGSDKGASYDEVIDLCRATGTKVVAIGQVGETIAALCKEKAVNYVRKTGDMSQIVKAAQQLAGTEGVVILSPAAASFDMFKNYADRGDAFIAAVARL